jgi:GxxExxY protein
VREPQASVDQLAHAVIGAAIEVHRLLGPGYLESVYEEALGIELGERAIPFERQVPFAVTYKGRPVGLGRLDLLVADVLVVELKAVEALLPVHRAQVLSYLRATNLPLGLLLNFKAPTLRDGLERIVFTPRPSVPSWRLGALAVPPS